MPPKEKPTTSAQLETQEDDKSKKPVVGKRQKIVKACKDCRRRKVKCDGATPCGTCRRSSIQCIFESTSPKRGATKHYIESLENRIHVIERALHSLGGPTIQLVEEAVRRQQLVEEGHYLPQEESFFHNPEDRFLINELGSPGYIQDIFLSNQQHQMDSQSSSTSSPKSINSNYHPMEVENYLQFYLIQIQPYFPLFVPSHFNLQYNAQELPSILIYAMCALAAYFQQQVDIADIYYQKVMMTLDEAIGNPSVSLVQTLLLLVKYIECTEQHYFFEKTKSLIARTIEVCKILKLQQHLVTSHPSPDPDAETKKRTFCMVFAYNTLICVEQGLENDFTCTLAKENVLPVTLPDESTLECQRYFIAFSFTLSQIQQHIYRVTKRQQAQNDKRNDPQILEENMALLQLQVAIENDIMRLPVNLNYSSTKQQFPALEEDASTSQISPMTRLLHMLYHLNVILLHYHYFIYPLPQGSHPTTSYPHRQMCTHSASTMVRLVEGLLAEPTHAFRYGPRGLSFVTHCITSALTVLRVESNLVKDSSVLIEEYQRCIGLVQRVTSTSPVHYHENVPPSPMTKRRNTISERPRLNPVPHTLLQSSSTNVQFHQPLHNIHATPLQIPQQPSPQRTLRGTTQSCQDLRSMQQIHATNTTTTAAAAAAAASFTQHRKPVSSVISSSTVSTLPYRGNSNGGSISSSRNVSPNMPYGKPQQYSNMIEPSQSTGYLHSRQQQQQQGKIRRIKKSQSIHGISTTYQRHQPLQQQQQQQLFQPSFQQQSLFYTPSPTQQQPVLHRPYRPSFDDISTDKFMASTTTTTSVVDDFTVNNMNMDFSFLNSLNIDHFSSRTEGHPLL